MKQAPELMTRALNLHNSIIRKARWSNFGYTVEQEGDSYVLVFYEALDAVIFCLQASVGVLSFLPLPSSFADRIAACHGDRAASQTA